MVQSMKYSIVIPRIVTEVEHNWFHRELNCTIYYSIALLAMLAVPHVEVIDPLWVYHLTLKLVKLSKRMPWQAGRRTLRTFLALKVLREQINR